MEEKRLKQKDGKTVAAGSDWVTVTMAEMGWRQKLRE